MAGKLEDMEIRLSNMLAEKLNDPLIEVDALAEETGITRTLLARAATGSSRLSAGTWRKLCQRLGVDYEKIIMEAEPEKAEPVCAIAQKQADAVEASEEEQEDLYLLVMYAEGRLQEDIKHGMVLDVEKLYRMLRALYRLKAEALAIDKDLIKKPA